MGRDVHYAVQVRDPAGVWTWAALEHPVPDDYPREYDVWDVLNDTYAPWAHTWWPDDGPTIPAPDTKVGGGSVGWEDPIYPTLSDLLAATFPPSRFRDWLVGPDLWTLAMAHGADGVRVLVSWS